MGLSKKTKRESGNDREQKKEYNKRRERERECVCVERGKIKSTKNVAKAKALLTRLFSHRVHLTKRKTDLHSFCFRCFYKTIFRKWPMRNRKPTFKSTTSTRVSV